MEARQPDAGDHVSAVAKPRSVALPIIRVGGKEYVTREHFDLARFAADSNKRCVVAMQKDRDAWKRRYIALRSLKRKRA